MRTAAVRRRSRRCAESRARADCSASSSRDGRSAHLPPRSEIRSFETEFLLVTLVQRVHDAAVDILSCRGSAPRRVLGHTPSIFQNKVSPNPSQLHVVGISRWRIISIGLPVFSWQSSSRLAGAAALTRAFCASNTPPATAESS